MTLYLVDLGPAAIRDVILGFIFVLFALCAVLVMVVILMQEGKGGGIGAAFGGAAAETFGVKAGTVNRFTSYLTAGFLGLALLYAGLRSAGAQRSVVNRDEPPAIGAPGDESPDGAGTTPPGDGAPTDGQPTDGTPTDGGSGSGGSGDGGSGDGGSGDGGTDGGGDGR
jgi:protein translocase SecG subunit